MDVLPPGVITDESEEEVETEETEAVVEVTAADARGYIFTVTEKGFGKRTPVSAYPVKHRGGYGVIDIKTTERNGSVAGIAHVFDEDQVLLITEQGMIIRVPVDTIRSIGRNTQGVRVINLDESDTVVAAVKVVEKEQPEENGGDDDEPVDEGPGAGEEPVH
jgi:DNA gyrase subunit A